MQSRQPQNVRIERLNVAFVQALKSPEIQESSRFMGYTPDGRASKDFAKVIATQTADCTEQIKSGAIQLT